MTGILDTIDAATEQRCACGCGQHLDPAGPSGWFATQDCQHEWAQQHAAGPRDVYRRPDPEVAELFTTIVGGYGPQRVIVSPALFEHLTAACREIGLGVQRLVEEWAPIVSSFAASCAELPPEEGPSDPMERALWLRRHRNNGPKPKQRAPRSLRVGQR